MNTDMKLMNKLTSPENLLTAWRAVRGNIPTYRRNRSSGPDGITLSEYERDLSSQLFALRHSLINGTYDPQQPKIFTIPKSDGSLRKLAILNVKDRIAQRAAQQVIEPLFEPSFLPCNFGYRPGRSIQDAIYCAKRLRENGYKWIVDGDIASCFDSLDHRLLLGRIYKQVEDERVLKLIEKWLNIGVLNHSLPIDYPNALAQRLTGVKNGIQTGVKWVIKNMNQEGEFNSIPSSLKDGRDYPTDSIYKSADSDKSGGINFDEEFYQKSDRFPEYERNDATKRALNQIAVGGFLLGSSWIRRNISSLGSSAYSILKTPVGKKVLTCSAIAGVGVIGIATCASALINSYNKSLPSNLGILQGSPLSPLLANIYLNSFDMTITQSGYRLVRFADDWVILCQDQDSAEIAYNHAVIALNQIHLRINRQKTHILAPDEPLEWLGEVIK
jgi:RNA-directed DNA polymerase